MYGFCFALCLWLCWAVPRETLKSSFCICTSSVCMIQIDAYISSRHRPIHTTTAYVSCWNSCPLCNVGSSKHMGLVDQRVWWRSWRSFRRYSDARRQPQKQKLETSGCLPTFRFVLVREANSWRCGLHCWSFRSCVRSGHAACWERSCGEIMSRLVDCVIQFSWRALILEIDLGHCSSLRKFAFGAVWRCSLCVRPGHAANIFGSRERSCGEILSRLVDCVIQFSWRAFIEIYFGYCSPLRKFAFGVQPHMSLRVQQEKESCSAQLLIDFVFFFGPQTLTGCFFQQQMTQWGTSGGNANAGTPCVRGSTNQAASRDNCAWCGRGFFKQSSRDGKPACWESVEFPMSRYSEISQNLKFVYEDVKNALHRNSRKWTVEKKTAATLQNRIIWAHIHVHCIWPCLSYQ